MRLSQFPPPVSPLSPLREVQVVYADYDLKHFKSMQAGFVLLAGLPKQNILHFDNQELAYNHIRNTAGSVPTVAVFDVLAPLSRIKSVYCVKELLENRPANLKMVVLTSDDEGYINVYAQEIRDAGGEFWKKDTDDTAMILWMTRSLEEGRVLPREEFLEAMGEQRRSFVER